MAAFTKALAVVTLKKRNVTSTAGIEQIRQARAFMGCAPNAMWRDAATKYLIEEAIDKDSGADDVYRLKLFDPFLGERDLHQVHDGTLTPFIAWRRQPVKVKRKSGKVWVKQVKTKTINLELAVVRRILNLAARSSGATSTD